jgi:hypothetical protein
LKAQKELPPRPPPPPQGGVPCALNNHEAAPPSGIEVVNAVEDLAQDEADQPKVAPSRDDELAQVKRQRDELKEALAREKEQRQTVHNNFLTRTEDNFELQKENKGLQKEIQRLKKENARLAQRPPSEEDRFMEGEIERAREETYAKCLADFEAKIVVLEEKHDAKITAAAAKYEEKCKEAYILEAELEETRKKLGVMGEENDDDESDVDAKKRKVIAGLKAQISEAHAAFGDTVDTATRTRSSNTVKKPTKSLSVKIKALANMFQKKTAEHQDLVEEVALERKENEDLLRQTTLSLETNLQDALRREKARAAEELTMRTSELDDHIVTLSRQLKVAEAKVAELQNVGISSFVSPILAPTSCPTTTPCGTPTRFRTPPSTAAAVEPHHSIPCPSRACEDVHDPRSTSASTTPSATFEYIDAVDATASIIHLRHLHTLNYITSGIDPDLSIDPDVTGVADVLAEPFICRWPDEWTKRVDALKKVRCEGWEAEVRMMNCIKMYGVSWTTLGGMIVRDHTSKGVPTMFWKHNLRKQQYEEVEWKVANDCERNEFGRVLKTPVGLGAQDAFAVHSSILTPSVQGDATPDVASCTKVKAFLQECMDVAGVEDESQLLSALKKYSEIMKVVKLRVKVTETVQELQDAVDAANPVLGGVLAAGDGGRSGYSGGSNPGKRRRNRNRLMIERQSESASISQNPTRSSTHTAPQKKSRLDPE